MPEFIKFFVEDNRTIWDHIIHFSAQLGIYSGIGPLKVRFFFLSLTGTVFSWSITLVPNSIHTWSQIEQKLHEQFYSCDN